jgi:hypothetical protein
VKGILNCTKLKGQFFFKGEIISKMQNFGEVINLTEPE